MRGVRLETSRIEAAILSHPSVGQAAVVMREDTPGTQRLAAYLVAAKGMDVSVVDVQVHVSARLPAHMVPEAFIALDELPLTTSGKLDHRALPAPMFGRSENFRKPSTSIEEIVAGVFGDVLEVERVGLDDDFFALGGNSLIATQVASRLGAALEWQVPVRALFEASTVEALAALLESHIGVGGRTPLVAQERPEQVPLSPAQQRMWFLNRFEPESTANNMPVAIRLSGTLNFGALQTAVTDVLARHESLRTVYPDIDGVGHQHVLPVAEVAPELTPIKVTESRINDEINSLVSCGFDVTAEVPFRVQLFTISESEHMLVFVAHQIAADSFSIDVLMRNIATAYTSRVTGSAPQWEPLPVQYADFAIWQRKTLGSEDDPDSVISAQVEYWKNALTGGPNQLDLPTDRPRPTTASYHGALHRFLIGSELRAGIANLARRASATEFIVVHAALSVLLSRLANTDDVTIGTPVAGRSEAALDDLVGMFVNTLVLRTQIDGSESFVDLLARVRETNLGAYGHAEMPFERLVEILDPDRSMARHPLFQVMLSFQNRDTRSIELPGLTMASVDVETTTAKFDLQVSMVDAGSGYLVELNYATDLFDASTMESFAQRFIRILHAAVTTPSIPVGDVDLLDDIERSRLLQAWNNTARELDGPTLLVDRFFEQVRCTPDAPALVFEDQSLTYAQFASRVNTLARHLISLGVGPETRVAVAMRPSTELLIGVYAVLSAGGTYVPVDPDQPVMRNEYILGTVAPIVVLTTKRNDFPVPVENPIPSLALDTLDMSDVSAEPVSDADRVSPLRADNTAYVIFTSGSTGRPKGVAVSHASVVNQIRWITAEYGFGPSDVVLQKTPFTFDVSVWELFVPFSVGAKLVIAAPKGHRDPVYLGRVIREHAVTATSFAPSMLAEFAAAVSREDCAPLRTVLVAGEAFPTSVAEQFAQVCDASLHNLYGSTETTVHATARAVVDVEGGSVPIGTPVWNTQVYVLDRRLALVPAGVPGELYLAGVQVARGYFGCPDLTAERFVASPFDTGARLYRTGDLVRWANDDSGELTYIGRSDFQVKLRGLRIEFGEIESALREYTSVTQTAVTTCDNQLVAYVTEPPGQIFDQMATRSVLSAILPRFMVPSNFVVLNEMPLDRSGKIDRKALPKPVLETRGFRPPSTSVERVVADVFAEVLGLDRVGLDDDFFTLGGNSLIATKVAVSLSAALETSVPVRLLFEMPTLSALATTLEQQLNPKASELSQTDIPELVAELKRQKAQETASRLNFLRALRQLYEQGVVQTQLATLLGVSQPTISDLLRRARVEAPDSPHGRHGGTPYEVAVRYAAGDLDWATTLRELQMWPYDTRTESEPLPWAEDTSPVREGSFHNQIGRALRDGFLTDEEYDSLLDALAGK